MAVMVVLYVRGGTLDQYDKATAEIFGTPRPAKEDMPAGLQSHVVAAVKDGVKIVDVWDSTQDYKNFGQKLLPALEHAGVPPTEPKIYEAYNFLKS